MRGTAAWHDVMFTRIVACHTMPRRAAAAPRLSVPRRARGRLHPRRATRQCHAREPLPFRRSGAEEGLPSPSWHPALFASV